jgi:hypothetical protein
LYNQISQLIEVRASKALNVKPVNHPAPPLNVLLSQIATMAQFALMGGVMMDVKMVPSAMRENKMAWCMGTFFLGKHV